MVLQSARSLYQIWIDAVFCRFFIMLPRNGSTNNIEIVKVFQSFLAYLCQALCYVIAEKMSEQKFSLRAELVKALV